MANITFIDYKTAIRTQYRTAMEKDVSGILSDPTPAQLRDFYLRLFEKGLSEIDEEILKLFLEAKENSSLKKVIENCNIGKLKPIINFLEGGNTENKARIEMAAILVDFQYRPFNKFKKEFTEEELKLMNDLRNNKSSREVSSNEMSNSIEIDSSNDPEPTADDQESEASQSPDSELTEIHNEDDKPKSKKMRYAAIIAILMGLGLIIYLALPKKECMQWSNDHYEMVDCDLKVNSLGIMTPVELLDESLVNLKKVQVCDTTSCFDKNGDAIIWYARSENGVDFFNGHGRHPENNRPLKPVTKYIISKYVKK